MDSNLTLINLAFNNGQILFEVSIWVIVIFFIVMIAMIYGFFKDTKAHRLVKLRIKLGGIGNAEFTPNNEDIQIAHQLWTELITRKVALEIIPDEDVIVEIYDSWYTLFTKTRELIGSLPTSALKQESTKNLIRIATEAINNGLRPHLTKWQSKYRNWYKHQDEQLKTMTPQEVQCTYPEYEALMKDMLEVNQALIDYATQLKKIVDAEKG